MPVSVEEFTSVFLACRDSLLAHALLCVRDHDAAEDAVQDTFLAASESLPRYDSTRSLQAWLVGILNNRLRLLRRQRAHELPAEPNRLPLPSQTTYADLHNAWQAELRTFRDLTPRQRDCLRLSVEGHTQHEIAAKLRIDQRTVSAHITKARAQLVANDSAFAPSFQPRQKITIYRRPQRTGAALANERLRRMR